MFLIILTDTSMSSALNCIAGDQENWRKLSAECLNNKPVFVIANFYGKHFTIFVMVMLHEDQLAKQRIKGKSRSHTALDLNME